MKGDLNVKGMMIETGEGCSPRRRLAPQAHQAFPYPPLSGPQARRVGDQVGDEFEKANRAEADQPDRRIQTLPREVTA
jgi:hypothetical protein